MPGIVLAAEAMTTTTVATLCCDSVSALAGILLSRVLSVASNKNPTKSGLRNLYHIKKKKGGGQFQG